MKRTPEFPRLAFALLPLLLAACDRMPQFDGLFGPNYKPLTYDVAQMAQPQAPADGKSVFCRASKGAARFARGWDDFADTDFALTPGSRVSVTLPPQRGGGGMPLQVWYDDPGQKIIFCPVRAGDPGQKISCSSIYALDDDLDDGIKRTFDVPDAVQSGYISCAHDRDALRK